MNNRPLTTTEGALCAIVAILFGLQAGSWDGYWHWFALVYCGLFALTAYAVAVRYVVGDERLARWLE